MLSKGGPVKALKHIQSVHYRAGPEQLVCFAQTAIADDAKNHEFLYGYLSGSYIYVEGQLMTTYAGSRAETLLFGKKDERYYFALHIYQ